MVRFFSALMAAALCWTAATLPDDPLLPEQWALFSPNGIRPGEAWPYTPPSEPVVVALIDTGVDLNHPDLADAIWTNPGEIPGNGIDDDGNGYIDDIHGWNFLTQTPELFSGDADLHGTHCAGTIAAGIANHIGIAGIAGGSVQLMVLKVLDGNAGGPTAGVAEAIRYARDNGADIVNLSLTALPADGGLDSLLTETELLFVAAAGNNGLNLDDAPPRLASLSLNNLISVAALQPDGRLSDTSNYGPTTVELAAPGAEILSTAPGGYEVLSGTSMAAPMVSAAAALLLAAHPELTPAELRSLLLRSADATPETAPLLTAGVLNLTSAMALAAADTE